MNIFTVDVPNKPLAICAIGDVQFTGMGKMQMGCSVDHLKEHLEWTIGRSRLRHLKDHTIRYIGTGDYLDLMSPSNREGYRKSGIYSTSRRVVSNQMSGLVEKLAKILVPYMAGKTVTLCRGHHWFLFDDWRKQELPCEDTDRYLGTLLGLQETRNWGVTEASAGITFRWPNGAEYRVLATHGQGNGQTISYGTNKMIRQAYAWEDIDAFIMGHTHKISSAKIAKLRFANDQLVERDVRVFTSGSFLKGYLKDDELYPEEGQLAPLAIGASAVSVYPKKQKEGRWLFDSVLLER